MRDCGGFRMGPCELMDLIGHDVNFSVTQSVFDAYFGDPRFTPSVVQQRTGRCRLPGPQEPDAGSTATATMRACRRRRPNRR